MIAHRVTGTGHGVGAALNVHEGPHSVSRVMNPQPLIAGMVVSKYAPHKCSLT